MLPNLLLQSLDLLDRTRRCRRLVGRATLRRRRCRCRRLRARDCFSGRAPLGFQQALSLLRSVPQLLFTREAIENSPSIIPGTLLICKINLAD
jgi:hypothetical protein